MIDVRAQWGYEKIEFYMRKQKLIPLIDTILDEKHINYDKKCNGEPKRIGLKKYHEVYYFPKYDLRLTIQQTPFGVKMLSISKQNEQNKKLRKYLKYKLRKEIFKRTSKFIHGIM